MPILTGMQNGLRYYTILNHFNYVYTWYENFIMRRAAACGEAQIEEACLQLQNKIRTLNQYITETKGCHEFQKQIHVEAAAKDNSERRLTDFEEFLNLKEAFLQLHNDYSATLNTQSHQANQARLDEIDKEDMQAKVDAQHQSIRSNVDFRADYYYNRAKAYFNEVAFHSTFNSHRIRLARRELQVAKFDYERLESKEGMEKAQALIHQCDKFIKNKKAAVAQPNGSTASVIQHLEDWSFAAEDLPESCFEQDLVYFEAQLEFHGFVEIIRSLEIAEKYRRVIAIDFDDTLYPDGKFGPQVEFLHQKRLVNFLQNIPDDVMVVLLTARQIPEVGPFTVQEKIDALEKLVGKPVFHSAMYTCGEAKIKAMQSIYERFIQFQPDSSRADVGLIDDRLSVLYEVKNAGFSGFHALPDKDEHFSQAENFIEKNIPQVVQHQILNHTSMMTLN